MRLFALYLVMGFFVLFFVLGYFDNDGDIANITKKRGSLKFMKMSTRKITYTALFSALGIVLMYMIRFPILPIVPFLVYDAGDIAIIICSTMLGHTNALIATVVVSIIQGITVDASSGWFGIVMHIFATGTYILVFSLLKKKNGSMRNMIFSLGSAVLAMTLVMAVLNITLSPIFWGLPRASVLSLLLPGIIPFNIIKGTINAVVSSLLFKPLSRFVKVV